LDTLGDFYDLDSEDLLNLQVFQTESSQLKETIMEIFHFSDFIIIKAIPPFDVNKKGQR
jgi:hypothetical protein